jgi:hypothetical protein
MINVLVGDLGGIVLGEIPLNVEQVSWRNKDVGQVTGYLPLLNVERYQTLLRFGNTLLLQFDNGLPDWGGVIDTPRSWGGNQIQVTGYSGEYLLKLRLTGRNDIHRSQSVGEIWRASLAEANQRDFTGLNVAPPWYGGLTQNTDYHLKVLFDVARELADDLSSADFYVTAAESGGHIIFTARFEERRGRDLDGVALVDGRNITNVVVEEQGPIYNHWYIVGAGNSWYTRYIAEARDALSANLYRLREQSEIQSQVSSSFMLHSIAEQRLQNNSEPAVSIPLTALNQPPAYFADYDIGDSLPIDAAWAGFTGLNGRVRVLGREYAPHSGVCNLIVEEYAL